MLALNFTHRKHPPCILITNPHEHDVYAPEKSRTIQWCPDILAERTDPVENLAKEIEKSKGLYLWWD